MAVDDTTHLHIRIAVLENELQHTRADKAFALASAQQTISTLTAIILNQKQIERPSQIQNQNQLQHDPLILSQLQSSLINGTELETQQKSQIPPRAQSQTQDERDIFDAVSVAKNKEFQDNKNAIQDLRQDLQKAKLENKRLREIFRTEIHAKAAKITKRYASDPSNNQSTVDPSSRAVDLVSELQQTALSTVVAGESYQAGGEAWDKKEPFEPLIDLRSGDQDESGDFSYDDLLTQEIRQHDDFEALEDLIGPEPGVTWSHSKRRRGCLERQPAPPRQGFGFGFRPERSWDGYETNGESLKFESQYAFSQADRNLERWGSREGELEYGDSVGVGAMKRIGEEKDINLTKCAVTKAQQDEDPTSAPLKSSVIEDNSGPRMDKEGKEPELKVTDINLAETILELPGHPKFSQDQLHEARQFSKEVTKCPTKTPPGGNQSATDEKADYSRKTTKPAPSAALKISTPKVKTEERYFAGGNYDLDFARNKPRERGRNRDRYRERDRCPPQSRYQYEDIDRAPLHRASVAIPRRQRALEAYDFTPSSVPDFNSAVLAVPVSSPASGSTPTTPSERKKSPFKEDRGIDPALWSSRQEREEALLLHQASCAPDDRKFPEFFRHDLQYRPEPFSTNVLRTVLISNLPSDISLKTLLSCVRGGEVFSAIICDTTKITGSKSALVVFHVSREAEEYVNFANEHSISFPTNISTTTSNAKDENQDQKLKTKPIFTLLSTPTWPINNPVLEFKQTRILCLLNFPRSESYAELRYNLDINEEELYHIKVDSEWKVDLQFSSKRAAERVYARLRGWRKFDGLRIEFGRDPCAQPLYELLLPSGPKEEVMNGVNPSVHGTVNVDEIDIESDVDGRELVSEADYREIRNIKVNSMATSAMISWADEMNDIAASANKATTISIAKSTLILAKDVMYPTQAQVVAEARVPQEAERQDQEPVRGLKGLAASRYATPVPGY